MTRGWRRGVESSLLVDLSSIEALDTFLEASAERPVLIYKHSLTCGSSAAAFEELQDLLAEPSFGVAVGMVKVQLARAVSNEIARRFGVRHESPQILLIKGGRVAWSASHFNVTTESISGALGWLQAEGGNNGSSKP